MHKLGKRQLTLQLQSPLLQLPAGLAEYPLELSQDGHALMFNFDAHSRESGIPGMLRRLSELGIEIKDLHSQESSLEDIFVGLVGRRA
jgi:ABC-2 type transport system ATP-binding protein